MDAQRGRFPQILALLAVTLFISLLLHAWTIYTLYRTRTLAREQIVLLSSEISSLRAENIEIDLPIRQNIPVNAEVQVNQTMRVPVDTTIEVDQEVRLPITTPLGETAVSFPIEASVPVAVEVPVQISQTVPISTVVSLDFRLPISQPIAATSLGAYLERLQARLEALVDQL